MGVSSTDPIFEEYEFITTIDEELRYWLTKRGLDPNFYVEDEAKDMVLIALKNEDFESAYIDEENGLVINFKDGQ